jgi:SGNH hydrolase-like domain, acetyltransferase AlgX
MLRRIFSSGLFAFYGLVSGWTLFFLLIEFFPGILTAIPLQEIKYYALKKQYLSDPALVFVYRQTNYVYRKSFVGDLYSTGYGLPAQPVDYVSTYDEHGFRKSSSQSPYNIAVIGDSFIEVGESDEKTFTEILKRETGQSVLNLGRGWYGPYQYLELLKRHALAVKPKYVLFAFFSGNDFNDLTEYEAWRAGGQYYFYRDLDNQNIISRFALATGDVVRYLKRRIKRLLGYEVAGKFDPSFFGLIRIGSKKVPMVLPRWETEVTAQQLAGIKSIVSEFNSICHEHGIVPILIYIPTATQVYGRLYSNDSNSHFIDRVRSAPDNPSLQAIAGLAAELDMDFINLLPVFQDKADEGNLLYYPFDTHWNLEGRRSAAALVASYLHRRNTGPGRTSSASRKLTVDNNRGGNSGFDLDPVELRATGVRDGESIITVAKP